MSGYKAVGLAKSASSMCDICQIMVRLEEKERPARIALLRDHGINPRAAVVEAQWLEDCKRGNVVQLAEERSVAPGTLAFFARAEFLVAYRSICGQEFPWSDLNPITLLPPHDQNGDNPLEPFLNSFLRPDDVNIFFPQAVLGDVQQLQQLCLKAGTLLLDHIRLKGCAYLDHFPLEEGWNRALDWLKQAAFLGVYLVGSHLPDLWLDFHLLIGVAYDVRRDTSRMEDHFEFFVKHLWSETAGPPIDWPKYQQKMVDQRNSLERGHSKTCFHAEIRSANDDHDRFISKVQRSQIGERTVAEPQNKGILTVIPQKKKRVGT